MRCAPVRALAPWLALVLLPALTGNLGKPGTGFLYLNGTDSRGIDEDYLAAPHLGPEAPEPISHMELVECLEDPARSQALFDFCHALLNTNEFVYVD